MSICENELSKDRNKAVISSKYNAVSLPFISSIEKLIICSIKRLKEQKKNLIAENKSIREEAQHLRAIIEAQQTSINELKKT